MEEEGKKKKKMRRAEEEKGIKYVCSGYSATEEVDENKYYLIEKINKILIF